MDKNLYLIDGHALIFKMYYAFLRRPMINSKGADMSILFGFTKYILELIERQKPTHLIMAFDPPGKTFRHKMFPEYKGTRPPTPQLIIDSLEPLIEICGALRIPVLMVPGFEADDVIGSMAKKCEKEGFDVYMVTPDKDYGQLISDHIFQYKPGKSGGEDEVVDKEGICTRYGIDRPEQVIDMLAICGDTADNVPGVKGVGEVGASKLISRYGSLKSIYEHLDELKPKQQEAFRTAEDHIAMSYDLVTIKTDIPLETDPETAIVDFNYDPGIADLFDKYEFTSLSRYIRHISSETAPAADKTLETTGISPAELKSLAEKTGKCAFVIDYEGEGIFAGIRQMTTSVAYGGRCLTACGKASDFKGIAENPAITKCGYDLKLQMNVLAKEGIELNGPLMDIELMHYLLSSETSHKANLLARKYLDVTIPDEPEKSVPKSLFDLDEKEEGVVSRDAEAAAIYLLSDKIRTELDACEAGKLYDTVEEPLIGVLSRMERNGVKIDLAQLRHFASELSTEMAERQARIRGMADEPTLNISSPKQIGIVLFEKLALDPKAKAKAGSKQYSTDEETLAALQDRHPIINEILEFRGVKKLLSTYIEPFPGYVNPETGKVHTTFNQALTSTGRLSSSRPNLQNIPIRTERGREIRKAFVPSRPDGVIMSADYSQIELRLMAHLSCDTHLIDAFRHDMDVHSLTASKIFGVAPEEVTPDQRRTAKTANFGIMYGISAFGLSQRLKIPRTEAKKIIDDYFANFPAISAFITDTIASARESGYVETLFGRRRYLPDINARNATVRSLAERNAVNAPIQGTSADIIKMAMIEVDREMRARKMQSRMVLQIHDELVFDVVPEEVDALKALVEDKMQNVIRLSIPLTVECNYGKNWLEAH